MILKTVLSIEIICPVCHTGYIGNNLKCNNPYCKEKHTEVFVKRQSPGNLKKLDNISIYEMEELGITSAITAKNHEEFQKVFDDFKEWYENNYGEYKNKNYVFLED